MLSTIRTWENVGKRVSHKVKWQIEMAAFVFS